MKRPLLPVALFYSGGILTSSVVPGSLTWMLMISCGVAVFTLLYPRARKYGLPLLLFVGGWTNFTAHTVKVSPYDIRGILGAEPQLATIRGKLIHTPTQKRIEHSREEGWQTLAQVELSEVSTNNTSWQPALGIVVVSTRGEVRDYFGGQQVEISGVIMRPPLAASPGTFSYRASLEDLGIYYVVQNTSEHDWRPLGAKRPPGLGDRFSSWARRALALGLPVEDESLRLEWALTLGWKEALTESVSEPFVQAATFHIFAVDGLRMAILFGILFTLFRAVCLPRKICALILIPIIWLYVALTGWPASAIRASVMLTLVVLGWLLKRPTDLLNSLFAAALAILIWQPQQVFQAGFQLSFLVVLCMVLMLPPLRRTWEALYKPDDYLPPSLYPAWRRTMRPPIRHGVDLVLTSFAAWVGSIPLAAYYFHIVTPMSTVANVLAVPLCALVLVSNFASLLVAGWLPGAAKLFNHAGWFLMECIRQSGEWFAGWPPPFQCFSFFYVAAPSLLTSITYYSLLLAWSSGYLFHPKGRTWKLSAVGILLCVWSTQEWQEWRTIRLGIVPTNGGIALLCGRFGNRLLVDCGDSNSVQRLTKPFLRAQGVNQLQSLILTHGDLRHIGGAGIVRDVFHVDRVSFSPVRFRSPVYRKLTKEFNHKPKQVQSVSRGVRLGSWTVLHPDAEDHFTQADDAAVVLFGVLNGTKVLLLSDLGYEGQRALLQRTGELQCDLVVAGLPKASEPLSETLLEALKPSVVIIADSQYPATERANERLKQRLGRHKFLTVYTSSSGAALVSFLNQGWKIETMDGRTIKSNESNIRPTASRGENDESEPAGSMSEFD